MTQDLIAKADITVAAPLDAVWKALVTPAAIKQYMFGTDVASDWNVGGPITWSGEWEGKQYKDKGVIRRLEPGRAIAYTHFSPMSGQPDIPENYHLVTIELSNGGGKTHVELTQDNNANEEERRHSEKNWKGMLDGLKHYLEKGARAGS